MHAQKEIDWYPTAWNVIAASCAYFPGTIEARRTLLERATKDPRINANPSNRVFRAIMLYRENGIEAIEGYLQSKSVWINNGPGGGNPFIMKTS